MSGKRAKSLRRLFITLYPEAQFDRHKWRVFKRNYVRSTKAERRFIMDQ